MDNSHDWYEDDNYMPHQDFRHPTMQAAHIQRLLEVSPIRDKGKPWNHLARPFDRPVYWDVGNGKENRSFPDSQIFDSDTHFADSKHDSSKSTDYQGLLFAPQTIDEYKTSPERLAAVDVLKHGALRSEQFKDLVGETFRNSEMPTELLHAVNRGVNSIYHPSGKERDPEVMPNIFVPSEDPKVVGKSVNGFYNQPFMFSKFKDSSIDSDNYVTPLTIMHEFGHHLDSTVTGIHGSSRLEYDGPDPREEAVADGLTERYISRGDRTRGRSQGAQPGAYRNTSDKDWGGKHGRDLYATMNNKVANTGTLTPAVEGEFDDFKTNEESYQAMINHLKGKPHMGEQFTQLKLFED